MPVPTLRRRHRLVLPLTLFGVLGLAACGQAAGATTAAPATTGATADAPQPAADGAAGDREAFRTCLAENGVTLPERGDGQRPGGAGPDRAPSGDAPAAPPDGAQPPADGDGTQPGGSAPGAGGTPPAPPGVDATTWAAAQQACADLMPARPGAPAG